MPGPLTSTLRGTFSGGRLTQGAKPVTSVFDEQRPTLSTTLGPCEDEAVVDQPTAQTHYFRREIKFRDPRGVRFEPSTSYTDHYPAKDLPDRQRPAPAPLTGVPFTAASEYQHQYVENPLPQRPVDPQTWVHPLQPYSAMAVQTTHQRAFPAWPLPKRAPRVEPQPVPLPEVDAGALLADTFRTTKQLDFPAPDQGAYVPRTVRMPVEAPPLSESSVKETTHNAFYKPHPLPQLVPVTHFAGPSTGAFDATTTYRHEFVPKDLPKELPHLTGIRGREGIRLPLPRRSLGVEVVGDRFFVLLPYAVVEPASARQVFTTVHDNQTEACILVLYGDSPVASENTLLGQFDIVNIPPAPKDVPRIEVTFHLSADLVLTAEARDMDTGRHKLWKQNGGTIVLHA